MFVKTVVKLQSVDGTEADYEVGADVDFDAGGAGWASTYTVGEPIISAADSTLKSSRLTPDPQGDGVLADGWSDVVCEALTEAYQDMQPDSWTPDPDHYSKGDDHE